MKVLFQWRCVQTVSNLFHLMTKIFLKLILLYSVVDADEIRRLGKRFRKLDLDNSGSLSVDEFMSLPELQQNPLVQRVIDIFDQDGNGEVDFKGKEVILICLEDPIIFLIIILFTEFIQGVSQFSVKGDKESKLRFAFRIYDMDNDGAISNGELFQVHISLTLQFFSGISNSIILECIHSGVKNDGGKQLKRYSVATNCRQNYTIC